MPLTGRQEGRQSTRVGRPKLADRERERARQREGYSSRQRHQHFRFRLFMLKEVWRAWQNVDGITDNNNSATLVPPPFPLHFLLSLPCCHPLCCQTPWLPSFLVALIAHLSCRGPRVMNFFSSAHTDMLSIIQINRRRRYLYKYDICIGALKGVKS